ncbi:SNF2-related protein [Hymenobacter citatus]|uniref:SNF2-related protein n=1 Tax=Hymenobacter citatus TaxID=2763506 RepID=UPI0031B57740
MFESYVVQRNARGQLTLQHQTVSAKNAPEFADGLDETDFELVGLTDQIQQDAVIKEFWPKKKITAADFFLKIFDGEKGDKNLQNAICTYVQERMAQILERLAGKQVFIMGKDGEPTWHEIEVAPEPANVLFHFRRNEDNTHYFPTIQYQGQKLDFQYKNAVIVCAQPAWLLLNDRLYHFRNEVDGKKLQPFLNKKFIVVPRQVEDSYYQRFVAPLVESFDVHARGFDIKSERFLARPRLTFSDVATAVVVEQEPPTRGPGRRPATDTAPAVAAPTSHIHFDLSFQYGGHTVPRGHDKKVCVRLEKTDDSYVFHRLIRNLEREQELVRALQDRALEMRDGHAVLDKATAFRWLHLHADDLARLGFTVQQGDTSSKDYFIGEVTVQVGITETNDWFDVHGTVHFGEFEVPFIKLRPYILNKRHEYRLPNGQIAIIPEEWFTQYLELFAFAEEHEQGLSLRKHHLALVTDLQSGNLAEVTMTRKLEKLREFEAVEDKPMPDGFRGTLRPYQKAGYNWLHFVQDYHFGGCLADDMGLGKAQPLHANILTPTGWKQMGDMQVGDVVVNSAGGHSRVTGVFPQGEKEIFRVTFTDGATAECCAEHLWAVQSPVQKYRGQGYQVKALETLRHDLQDRHGNTKWFVPMVAPVSFAPQPIPIDPYFLGLLLGDGCFRQNSISLSTADVEIVNYAAAALPDGLRVRSKEGSYDHVFVKDVGWTNALMQRIKELGLKGQGSKDKFIPEAYLFNDAATRLSVLQGLMDTDGYVSATGDVCQFTSVSTGLIAGVTFLVQSLGGTVRQSSKVPTYSHNGEQRTGLLAYTLTLSLPPHLVPFRLQRKAILYRPKTKYQPYRGIKSVELVGTMLAQCISVDAPDRLYVTDNFVLTHNTIQTLALLLQRKESGNAAGAVSLLVMPTSLIYNWLEESLKFTPGLRVLVYTGTYRDKNVEQFQDYDLVLTSYGIVRLDIELLKTYKFDYVILDESQAIKNPSSTTSQAVRGLHSRHRLILTGTPVENSTMDLWSQMSFINPGLLGTQHFFRKEFLKPIEKGKDEGKMRRLHTLIKPFILRRHKAQVATELPEKIENLSYCPMTEEQQQCYEETKSYYRNKILQNIEEHGTASTQFMLLQGLTKLRQIANHPRMAHEDYEHESGKLREVVRMLRNVVAEGHKVLVFSQFVKHLDIIRHALDEKNLRYAYLDGNTRERHKEVARFQEDEKLRIFLISLKAGGVGLNLTAADYVFILDPWWNPAVEAQAVDRAHRIGQERTVFTYKFITKNTVEEKILALQNRKIQLVTDLITTDEAIIKSLTKEDIEELLG